MLRVYVVPVLLTTCVCLYLNLYCALVSPPVVGCNPPARGTSESLGPRCSVDSDQTVIGSSAQGDRLREVVGQLQEAVHPGAAAALPEAFRRAVAAQQAASRFPLDAQSPLQLRDVRPPALRSLPDPDIALATARWPLPSSADSGDAACHQDNGGETATSSDDGTGSTSRAGVYIWHDAQAKRKRRPVSGSSESGSSTQPAAWLRGIQQNTQQKPTSEPEHAAPMDAPREQVDDELLPVGRN